MSNQGINIASLLTFTFFYFAFIHDGFVHLKCIYSTLIFLLSIRVCERLDLTLHFSWRSYKCGWTSGFPFTHISIIGHRLGVYVLAGKMVRLFPIVKIHLSLQEQPAFHMYSPLLSKSFTSFSIIQFHFTFSLLLH